MYSLDYLLRTKSSSRYGISCISILPFLSSSVDSFLDEGQNKDAGFYSDTSRSEANRHRNENIETVSVHKPESTHQCERDKNITIAGADMLPKFR